MSQPNLKILSRIAVLEPGLYIFRYVADSASQSCVSLHQAPLGRGSVDFFPGEGVTRNTLSATGDCVIARVKSATSSVLIVEYHPTSAETGSIDLQIERIETAPKPSHSQTVTSNNVLSPDDQPSACTGMPLTLLGHVERRGDVTVSEGQWLGDPQGNQRIEGFCVTGNELPDGLLLALELRAAGYELHGLDRSAVSLPEFHALHRADLENADSLLSVVEQVQPRFVVHLAAISFVAHGDADEIYRVNVLGTRHLLEALSKASVKPAAVLLASSANIYGNAQEECLAEDTLPAPANDYAVSKLAMEYMTALHRERLPLMIARPFNYTGVGQSVSFLLPKIIDHFRRKAPVIELGNLDVARDFSDVRVVAEVYRRLLETPAAVGGTFNVCSGQAYSLQEVLSMAREISGHDIEVRVNPAFVRANEVKRLLGSRARLESVIGPVKNIPLRETVRWMLEAV